jgi:hypothetical protein
MGNVFGHIPWCSSYWPHIPNAAKPLKAFRMFGIERAAKRRAEGSLKKDLFHYLVTAEV